MITHILKNNCKLQVKDDVSYKLIAIKNQQVDNNQHTPVQLTDFLSVLVINKRADEYNSEQPVLFTSNYILNFLESNMEFVRAEEVIKIFIMQRKFRLTLSFIEKTKAPFKIEFFIMAIEANAYEIAFYLMNVYEESII